MKILVTGGAGFIGSNLLKFLLEDTDHSVINLDSLSYAGNLESLESIDQDERYTFENVDITDGSSLERVFVKYHPDIVFHLAAESHVDRSIDNPEVFLNTNILGTFNLLNISQKYLGTISDEKRIGFKFIHVSTDEVFGDLGSDEPSFTETTPYDPSSPYAASKASSDHLVRSWHRTYNFPSIITNCSNNYGPNQFPEKLIPLMILNATNHKPLPIYGDGNQIRDWLYVEDHVRALLMISEKGKLGETYNIGSDNEIKNIDIVKNVCKILDELIPNESFSHSDLITYVDDRPGHDRRYAINPEKINREIGWFPQESFGDGIRKTILWYLDNKKWCENISNGSYLNRIGTKID